MITGLHVLLTYTCPMPVIILWPMFRKRLDDAVTVYGSIQKVTSTC